MGSRAKGEKLERAEAPAKRCLWHKCGWVTPKLNNQTTYWKDCTSSCYKWRWWFSRSVVSDSCNPMGCSPPGSSVHEILQKRILQWVAISFSRDLPNSGIEPGSPAVQADSLLTELLFETANLPMGFPGGISGKEPVCQRRRLKRPAFDPYVGKIPWRRAWQPTPVFLPGESHGQRCLAGYSPWGRKELDTTEAT